MAIPFTKYLDIKDSYCLTYFGNDFKKLKEIISARECITKEFKELRIFIACKDCYACYLKENQDIILESELHSYTDKVAYFRNLDEEDVRKFLFDSKIPIPDNF